jgi:hypothetical protein
MFNPTYLYIKTHDITGLKYFGKTISDPYKYRGSGVRWLNHLSVHGNKVTTEIVGYYEVLEECNKAALEFSEKYDIVKSDEWANLIIEDGLMGGFTEDHGKKIKEIWENLTDEEKEYRRKISNPRIGMTDIELARYEETHRQSMIDMYNSDNGKKLKKRKQEIGKSMLVNGKRILTEEARQKMRESAKRTNEIRAAKKKNISLDE